MPRNPRKTPCSRPGCHAWAVRGSDPPLCASHAGKTTGAGAPQANQNRRTHGFYGRILHPDEAADLQTFATATTIDDEIAIARVALRRTLAMLGTGATLGQDPRPLGDEEYVRLIGLAFQGVRTIARLLAVQKNLGRGENQWQQVVGRALDALSEKWGVEL